jgi:hypothetical protein
VRHVAHAAVIAPNQAMRLWPFESVGFLRTPTPAERSIVLVLLIALCLAAGLIGLVAGFLTTSANAEHASRLRASGVVLIAIAVAAWLVFRLIGRWRDDA